MFSVPFDFFGSLGHLWKPILFVVAHKLGAAGVRMGENDNHIFNFFTQALTDGGGGCVFWCGFGRNPPLQA